MKELSIEQKAQRYDEALKAAIVASKDEDRNLKATLERIFPELKESGDESIIRDIRVVLESSATKFFKEEGKMPIGYDRAVAWLEKQGEHANFRNSIQVGDKVTRNQDGMLVNLSQLERVAKPAEKQGSQNLANSAKTCKDEPNTVVVIPKFRVGDVIRPKGSTAEYTIESISGECYHGKGWGLHISCDDDYELVEQKPAWSEEDEAALGDALWCCKQAASIAKDENDMGNIWYTERWLKSIKGRVQPQTKQEWSEEDEQTFIKSVEALEDFGKFELADWLKEHKKQFLKPQNTWQPSDEQMNALNYVVNLMASSERPTENDLYYNILKSLRQQLKKLKG